ncbi:hypothetical protein L0222_03680 [bacterium]|nr:hypothetical protein [bacterium]MCI0603995.1 hypothetical protein [bacterium]
MYRDQYELPYFDEAGNEFVRELNKQDAFLKRGGRLSAAQMIKYENRVAMLAERLNLIFEAVKEDAESVKDYLESIEQNRRMGLLPRKVYQRFQEQLHKSEEESKHSERDRDRYRVVSAGVREEKSNLTDMPVSELLDLYQKRGISREILFQEFRKRENAGIKLQRMDPDLWGRYRSWVAEQRRRRQMRS